MTKGVWYTFEKSKRTPGRPGAQGNQRIMSEKNTSVNENLSHAHAHVDGDGNEYTHTHEHGHSHTHTHQNTKAVLNRMSRIIGHMESVKRMVEDGRDCSEVLIQLAAVKAAINSTANVILKDHIEHCMVDAVETGDMEAVKELTDAIDRFMK